MNDSTKRPSGQKTIAGAKYQWRMPTADQALTATFATHYNIARPIAETLIHRGFDSQASIDTYLNMRELDAVASPFLLADGERAAMRLKEAIEKGDRILIYGDYDVDGMSSTALTVYCLTELGAQVNFYLPNRVIDGYGITVNAIRRAAANGYRVVMTVDNGITAFDAAQEALSLGIDLIITDHHRPKELIPKAYAIVNPLRHDCPYPCKILAGVGVAFKVMTILYTYYKRSMPDKVYELLALGTIADVVPLRDENRYWVKYGLQHMNRLRSLPIAVLKNNCNIKKEELVSLDIGFSLAPQLNALGRLSDPRRSIAFLIGADARLVREVGALLLELNQVRKEAERSILYDIEVAIMEGRIDLANESIIMAAHHDWPIGVVGLVASRLVNAYGKPALLFHYNDKDNRARGSGRSIPAFNLFDALAAHSSILDHFGGHGVAVGLSLPVSKLPLLKQNLEETITRTVKATELQQTLSLDAEVVLPQLTEQFMADMARLEPFGHDNEQPIFCIHNLTQVSDPILLKDQHVKCTVTADGITKSLLFFNRPDLFAWLLTRREQPFHCAAAVTQNHWNNRTTIELQGYDVAVRTKTT